MVDPNDSATTGLGDLLRQIALRRAPADRSPLIALGEIALPGMEPVSLPLPPELAVAWRALIGEEAHPWQRQALHAAGRGESLVLEAPPPLGVATLLLLAAERRMDAARPGPSGTTLLLAPTPSAFQDLARTAASLDALLGGALPHVALDADTSVPRSPVALLLTTPALLHSRILRHHDRAWRWLWPLLRRVIVPGADEGPGAALGHLRWLLRRVSRLRPGGDPPQLLVSMRPAADQLASASLLVGRPLQTLISSSGGGVTTWAVWRSGADLVTEALSLAAGLRSAGLSVQLGGRDELERALLDQAGAAAGLSIASWVRPAGQALIMPWSGEAEVITSAARSGFRLVVALADPSPSTWLPRHRADLLAQPQALPWPQAHENAYVAAAHLRCAAEEQPLTEDEILAWQSEQVLERLERRGRLARLPELESIWQPAPGDDDPYEQLSVDAVSGPPTAVFDEDGELLDEVDPSLLERRLYPGAALPGARVSLWTSEGEVLLSAGSERWTSPVRRTQVTIREELGTRSLRGTRAPALLRWGKVVVQEEISGRLEWENGATPTMIPLEPPLTVQWTAPACWIDVGENKLARPDTALLWATVVPLLVRCRSEDVVACGADGALFLVEAQPGGRGLAQVLYEQAEQSMRLAHMAALALAKDARWADASKLALRWLDAIFERPVLELSGPAQALKQPAASASPPPEEQSSTRVPFGRRPRGRGRPGVARPSGTVIHPLPPREPDRPPFLTRRQDQAATPVDATRAKAPQPPPEEPAQPAVYPASRPGGPRPSSEEREERSYDEPPARPGRPAPTVERRSPEAAPADPPVEPEPARAPYAVRPQPQQRRPAEPEHPAPRPRPEERRPAEPGSPARPQYPSRLEERQRKSEPAPEQLARDAEPRAPLPPSRPQYPARAEERQRRPEPEPAPEPQQPERRAEPRAPQPPSRPSYPAHGDQRQRKTEPEPEPEPQRPQPHGRQEEPRAPQPPSRPQYPARGEERQRRPEPEPPERPDERRPVERPQYPARGEERQRRPEPPRPQPPERREERRPAERSQYPPRGAEPPRPQQPARGEERRPQYPARDEERQRKSEPPRPQQPGRRAEQRELPLSSGGDGGRSHEQRPSGPAERGVSGRDGRPARPDQRGQPARPPEQGEQRRSQPPRPPAPPPPPPHEERPPDAAALIERARRLREQREALLKRPLQEQRQGPARSPADEAPVEPRFHAGQRIFCVPYGEGVVRESQIEDGRELLQVAFANHGRLQIDPAVSLVRLLGAEDPDEDEEQEGGFGE